MMSSNHTTDNGNVSTGSIFCQLRLLAVQVEGGIKSLQTELGPDRLKRDVGDKEHAKAINFLLHTKKDMADLRNDIQMHRIAFSQENAKFNKIQELMGQVLTLQSERLERVESYFQKYGYKKPVMTSDTNIQISVPASCNGGNKCSAIDSLTDDEQEESDNSDVDDLADNDEGSGSKTPPPHSAADENLKDSNIMRTPKLEDLYSNLSEETIYILKHGVGSTLPIKNLNKDKTPLKSAPGREISSLRTPEPPELLTGAFVLNNTGKFSAFKSQALTQTTPETPKLQTPGLKLNGFSSRDFRVSSVSNFNNNSIVDTPACVGRMPETLKTPEMPSLLMPRFEMNAAVNPTETDAGRFAKPYFQAPAVPELKTYELWRNDLARYSHTASKNVNMSKAGYLSTPQDPKLSYNACLSTPEAPKLSSTYFSTSDAQKLSNGTSYLSTSHAPKLSSNAYLSTPEAPKLSSAYFSTSDAQKQWNATSYLSSQAPKLSTSIYLSTEAPKPSTATSYLSTSQAPKLSMATYLSTPDIHKLSSDTNLSTPEIPQLLTRSYNFSHYTMGYAKK